MRAPRSIALRARHGPAVAIAIGLTVVYGSVVLSGVGGVRVQTVVAEVGSAAAALVAAGLAFRAAGQTAARARASWLLLGAGLLAWGLADGIWTVAELMQGVGPGTPSLVDVGYLSLAPLVSAGILIRPPLQPRRGGRRALAIELLVAVLATTAVGWVLVLAPFAARSGADPLLRAITLAYPVGDLAILLCVLFALVREAEPRLAVTPLPLGLAALATADAAHAVLVSHGISAPGHPIDVLWFAAMVSVGLAAWQERAPLPSRPRPRRRESPWHLGLPIGLLTLATLAVGGDALRRGAAPGVGAASLLTAAWLLLLGWVYLGFRRAAAAQWRERRLRVGHAGSFRRVQERFRQVEAVRDVTAELTRELDLAALFALIARRAADLVQAPIGVVLLWDAASQVLVPRAWHGVGDRVGALRLRQGEGAAGRAVELGRGVIVNDYATAREASPRALEQVRVSAALAVPLSSLGQLIGVVVACDDRTGRSFHTSELRLLELFADQAAVAIEHARLVDEAASVEALRELARLKTELLSTVSHELRTPLTLVHGYAELLSVRAELLTPEEVTMMANEILLGSRTLIRLVDDLLDFSQRDTTRLRLNRTRVELVELLRRHLQSWRGEDGGDRLRLEAMSPLDVLADPARLDEIIRNLLSNAVRHAPRGPITVRAWRRGDRIVLEVADRGPGIPADELPRVWDSFFRGERARNSPHRGSGLGLAVVRQLVELHGGHVEVESREGEGATFRVNLPAASDLPDDPPADSPDTALIGAIGPG